MLQRLKLFSGKPPEPAKASIPLELFAPDGLRRLTEHEGYKAADPYPHLVLDNLFNPAALDTLLSEWPDHVGNHHDHHNDGTFVKRKFGTTWKTKFGVETQRFFSEMNSPPVLKALEQVTGIPGLIPDPYLFGGGLHATGSGGKLAIHADYNKHPFFELDRRLNLLVYLNHGWKEENAGWLELWDQKMTACQQRVLPVFNRTVVFSTTKTTYHGQPAPIVGPEALWRKSMAFYYFSNGREDESTDENGAEQHETLWQERPGEGF